MSPSEQLDDSLQLPVLLVNGVRQDTCPARPADMLLQQPKGPYTAAHAVRGLQIEAWPRHTSRLAEAVLLLHRQSPAAFGRLMTTLQGGTDSERPLQQLLDTRLQDELAPLAVAAADQRMAVTILLCDPPSACASDRTLDVIVHAMALPPAPAAPGAIEAAVVGRSRRMPEAKHSQWVVDRQPLTADMPEGAGEGILCDAQGHLLEGLLTNLFMVADDGSGGAVVATAAAADGVLPGVMRGHVIAACAALGVPVAEAAPHWSTHDQWREAFVTNSLRGLQPLKRIVCEKSGLCGSEPWAVTLPPPGRSSLTDQLRRHVEMTLASEVQQLQPETPREGAAG